MAGGASKKKGGQAVVFGGVPNIQLCDDEVSISEFDNLHRNRAKSEHQMRRTRGENSHGAEGIFQLKTLFPCGQRRTMSSAKMAIVLPGILALVFASSASAGALEEGLAAMKRHDFTKAMAILRPLANQGNPVAELNVGEMIAFGHGVAEDKPLGMEWYRKAAEQGNAEAEARIGSRYEAGNGVPRDYAAALIWLKKAAEQDNALGESMLGGMYVFGQGVPKDTVTGVKWLTKGADHGDPNAQMSLAFIYQGGRGVPPDDVRAYMWCDIAMSHLPPETAALASSQDIRPSLAAKMRPDQIAEAKRLARAWTPKSETKMSR